eukprot:g1255.t1
MFSSNSRLSSGNLLAMGGQTPNNGGTTTSFDWSSSSSHRRRSETHDSGTSVTDNTDSFPSPTSNISRKIRLNSKISDHDVEHEANSLLPNNFDNLFSISNQGGSQDIRDERNNDNHMDVRDQDGESSDDENEGHQEDQDDDDDDDEEEEEEEEENNEDQSSDSENEDVDEKIKEEELDRSFQQLGPFQFNIPPGEREAIDKYRKQYHGFRLGKARGARGEVNRAAYTYAAQNQQQMQSSQFYNHHPHIHPSHLNPHYPPPPHFQQQQQQQHPSAYHHGNMGSSHGGNQYFGNEGNYSTNHGHGNSGVPSDIFHRPDFRAQSLRTLHSLNGKKRRRVSKKSRKQHKEDGDVQQHGDESDNGSLHGEDERKGLTPEGGGLTNASSSSSSSSSGKGLRRSSRKKNSLIPNGNQGVSSSQDSSNASNVEGVKKQSTSTSSSVVGRSMTGVITGMNNNNGSTKSTRYNKSGKERTGKISPFLSKLWQMMSADTTKIRWSDEGRSIVIINLEEFTNEILPTFFKHRNFSSFLRQLNMYRFRTTKKEQNYREFQNPMFVRDKQHLLKHITRKIQNRNSDKSNTNSNSGSSTNVSGNNTSTFHHQGDNGKNKQNLDRQGYRQSDRFDGRNGNRSNFINADGNGLNGRGSSLGSRRSRNSEIFGKSKTSDTRSNNNARGLTHGDVSNSQGDGGITDVEVIHAVQGMQDTMTLNNTRSRALEQRVLELEAIVKNMVHTQEILSEQNARLEKRIDELSRRR